MNKVYYKKKKQVNVRKLARSSGLVMLLLGVVGLIYVSFPILSWQFYFSAFAAEGVISPIPQPSADTSVVSLLSSTSQLIGVDYTHAENWFPSRPSEIISSPTLRAAKVSTYTISIPKINIMNAVVSTVDTNLIEHMVQYNSNATPPENGTAVVFGHSTLPQLYDPANYKTILAKAYTLKKGDTIIATVENIAYMYKIEKISIVDAEDTSMFSRKRDDSYLTLVTCTPPGTIWKRLVLEARLQEL